MEHDPPEEKRPEEDDDLPKENDFSILERVEGELADVERALGRLDDGTYGTCEACGGPIGDDRLATMPSARFCAQHEHPTESG